MRLIQVNTLQLHEFLGEDSIPSYAILSHTWGTQEISYLDLLYLTSDLPPAAGTIVQALLRSPSRDSPGFRKIEACCKLAKSRGIAWVWIDSCCIDKSSSAELSEAINSMWKWYRGAKECYAYLSDMPASVRQSRSPGEAFEAFRRVRWFERGWTLQELLAPRKVLFCSNDWEIFAERFEIRRELSTITNIPLVFLDGTYEVSDCSICSVAMKMSWLSRRQTTRIEDMAYCMLGLFDVHMPLIYGEGRRAFMRLQMEIIKKTDDDSIYAWAADMSSSGLLASWPTAFAGSGNIVQIISPDDNMPWLPPTMTSIGLEMKGRYGRNDPDQLAIDAQHNVHTITTAFSIADDAWMLMHCTPCEANIPPVTQQWRQNDSGKGLLIRLRRHGATWQRVNCRQLEFQDYAIGKPSRFDAYSIYYVKQQGL